MLARSPFLTRRACNTSRSVKTSKGGTVSSGMSTGLASLTSGLAPSSTTREERSLCLASNRSSCAGG